MTARRTDPHRLEPGMPARWPGECCICHDVFPKNARIVKVRGLPCHVACYVKEHE